MLRGSQRRPGRSLGRPGRSSSQNRTPDGGAAAVEAAFVFPVLLLLVFGIIDFGRMVNTQLNVTQAAAQGARVASFGIDPAARVDEIAGSAAEVDDMTVCTVPADLEEYAEVRVSYTFEFATPLGVLMGLVGDEIELTGRGAMPCR